MSRNKDLERYLGILCIIICLVFPLSFLLFYDLFAGGVLNGFAGTQRQYGAVSGRMLTEVVYPTLALLVYGLFLLVFAKLNRESRKKRKIIFMAASSTLATGLIVFWTQLTT